MPITDQHPGNVLLNSVLSLICDGEKQLPFPPGVEVVALIGRTGASKSTTVEILAEVHQGHGLALNGQNIITEQNDTSSTRSKTLIPVWFYNNRTNTLFLDCPGFEDTRGPEYDIAVAHFNRLLLSKTQQLKLILVEAYSNVVRGGERNALPTLLHHVTGLVRNIDKYRNSIALFASKADGSESDDQIFQNIATFLRQSRADPDRTAEEIKLMDILLEQQPAGSYSRIGSLRFIKDLRNDVNSAAVLKNKNTLDEIMYNNLRFTQVQDGDFDYTISDSSILGIHQLADDITTGINANIAQLTRSIVLAYFPLLEVNMQEKTLGKFIYAFSYLFGVKQQLEKSENLDQFVECTIPEMAVKLNVTFSPVTVTNIRDYKDYLTYFQEVSRNKVVPKMWSRGFATAELNFLYISQRCMTYRTQQARK